MSAGSRRRWPLVLAAMGVLTVASAVGYAVAPSSDNARSVDASLAAKDRIVVIDDEGELVVLDHRDPTEGGAAVGTGEFDEVESLAIDDERKLAYIAAGDPSAPIRVIDLATGHEQKIGHGTAVTVGRIAFPQLAAGLDRPNAGQAAYATERDGRPRIVIQNLTTGASTPLDPFGEAVPFDSIEDLAWGPFDNQLYGIADGGSMIFRLDSNRAGSLDDAVRSAPLATGRSWTGITAYRDGVAAILTNADAGDTEIVELDSRTLDARALVSEVDGVESIDSDPSARDLLITTQSDELLHLSADMRSGPELVRKDVRLAAW